MTGATFSVVISTYNRSLQLRSCLAALARSAHPSDAFEVIVVDDGGQAPLEWLVAEFRSMLRVTLVAQRNGGPASGRNLGARVARHEFLAFTDDDCEPAPDWLPALGRRLQSAPDALVGGRTVNGLPDNPYSCASQLIVDMAYAFYNVNPADARFFASNNLALGTRLFRESGGFDERFRVSEDREFCDRWRHHDRSLAYEPAALVVHRHPLTVASFWRQQFQFGRGAAQFHSVCAARHSGRLRDHVGFHLQLPRWWRQAIATEPHLGRPARVLPRLAVWQLANACGYVCERLRPERRSPATFGDPML